MHFFFTVIGIKFGVTFLSTAFAWNFPANAKAGGMCGCHITSLTNPGEAPNTKLPYLR